MTQKESNDIVYILFVFTILVFTITATVLYARMRLNRNNLDYIVKKEFDANRITCDSVINISDLMSFEWDTLYYYSGGCALSEINHDFGYELNLFYEVTLEKIIFCNKGKVVHFQEWPPDYGQEIKGVVFLNSCYKKFKVSKNSAKFMVSVRNGEIFYLTPINPILFR